MTSNWRNSCEFIEPRDEPPEADVPVAVLVELFPVVPVLEAELLGEEALAKVLAKLGAEVPLVDVVGVVELLASIEKVGIGGRGWAIGEIELIFLYPSVKSVAARRAHGLLSWPKRWRYRLRVPEV